jgi:hypothetical protein
VNLGNPARGLAFIRHIETVETYGNSPIVITPKTRDKIAAQQFTVVAAGDFEYCEDREDCERCSCRWNIYQHEYLHEHEVREGDWVLVRNRAWQSTPDPSVFVIKVDDILGVFREQ